LAFHNFEWLASSRSSIGHEAPVLENGIVRIPILFDDFDLHDGARYDTWEHDALDTIARAIERWEPATFSLHDCYGADWLPHYEEFLGKVTAFGETGTLDELAAHTLLRAAL
ncbi:MAG: hypothetical protein QOD92_1892, partial [Acidimicrobiaceae bacterium]